MIIRQCRVQVLDKERIKALEKDVKALRKEVATLKDPAGFVTEHGGEGEGR